MKSVFIGLPLVLFLCFFGQANALEYNSTLDAFVVPYIYESPREPLHVNGSVYIEGEKELNLRASRSNGTVIDGNVTVDTLGTFSVQYGAYVIRGNLTLLANSTMISTLYNTTLIIEGCISIAPDVRLLLNVPEEWSNETEARVDLFVTNCVDGAFSNISMVSLNASSYSSGGSGSSMATSTCLSGGALAIMFNLACSTGSSNSGASGPSTPTIQQTYIDPNDPNVFVDLRPKSDDDGDDDDDNTTTTTTTTPTPSLLSPILSHDNPVHIDRDMIIVVTVTLVSGVVVAVVLTIIIVRHRKLRKSVMPYHDRPHYQFSGPPSAPLPPPPPAPPAPPSAPPSAPSAQSSTSPMVVPYAFAHPLPPPPLPPPFRVSIQ
jgi:hypothetical protein